MRKARCVMLMLLSTACSSVFAQAAGAGADSLDREIPLLAGMRRRFPSPCHGNRRTYRFRASTSISHLHQACPQSRLRRESGQPRPPSSRPSTRRAPRCRDELARGLPLDCLFYPACRRAPVPRRDSPWHSRPPRKRTGRRSARHSLPARVLRGGRRGRVGSDVKEDTAAARSASSE